MTVETLPVLCIPCAEPEAGKPYQELPVSLCPCEVEIYTEPPSPPVQVITEYCLREFMRNVANNKFCTVPPAGCA